MRFLWLLLICICGTMLQAQSDSTDVNISGLSIAQEDDFTDWNFYGDGDDPIGYLRLRWAFQKDWTEWDYRIGEVTGSIKQRTKEDPNIWELRSAGSILTLKTIYTGDFNQWRITDDTKTLTFATLYENVYDGWKSNSKAGQFEIYTQWEMDPRDWVIHDNLKPEISQPFKIAMIFLASYYSSPKY